jgi:hypothetical protein
MKIVYIDKCIDCPYIEHYGHREGHYCGFNKDVSKRESIPNPYYGVLKSCPLPDSPEDTVGSE